MTAFSPAGKKKLAAQVFLFVINLIVLALAAQVNQFQDFFFIADLFPLVYPSQLCTPRVLIDYRPISGQCLHRKSTHGNRNLRGPEYLLAFAFSTSRWQQIPFQCDVIPAGQLHSSSMQDSHRTDPVSHIEGSSDARTWCKNVQALKGFVWVEFVTCFIITLVTLRYAATQSGRGNKHIWQMPLSRYRPRTGVNFGVGSGVGSDRGSEFLQYGRFD
ncbi:hypothetical protein D9756_007305 [Leucocoprinus leucothites]|uniref:Transmembrane protein n=1 Tax=Leucocoprinus leucothites TaxID=201217 RepID=A0A8H5D7Y9_9AGAR|nr:hypothetical protein D9756_007305 [Leucoagaricus leucothites]